MPDLTIKENIEVTAHLSKNPLNVDDLLRSLGLYEHRNKMCIRDRGDSVHQLVLSGGVPV